MIQVNELKIGNLVYYNGNHKEVGIVTSLQPKFYPKYSETSKDIFIGLNQRHDIVYNVKDIQPIPLTEELLLKCGFEKQIGLDDMFYWTLKNKPNRANRFEIFETEGGYETISEAKIEFLHQLQNCYFSHYLDGTELEINLK